MKISELINVFQPAEGPPPQSLVAFLAWAQRGSFPVLFIAAALSALTGAAETMTAYILGLVVDRAGTAGPEGFFTAANIGVIVLAVGFFLVARPVLMGLTAAANSVVVQPNVMPLVLARLNRWTLGQSVTFFDEDFAGRIAQKQMQTARAVTDITVELINVVAFALATLAGTLLLLGSIDLRIALVFLVWLAGYLLLIRYFLPRIRQRSKDRAGTRAMVSGQIVDTITNIKTVRLFAHSEFEDRAALGALDTYRVAALGFGRLAASFRFFLMTLAGALPVILVGGTLVFWSQGTASTGDIVAAGTLSIRIAQMTGWVSFTLMNIYASIGEVEDGIRTLTPRNRLEDAPNAAILTVPEGEITFDAVGFAYGREVGGVTDLSLTIHPGEKVGIVGASGAGKSTLVALLLRLYDAEQGRILIDDQDISGVTQDSLRRNIAMVTQDTAMFNRSARDNIMYGRPDATEEELVAAARKAEADGFIRDLMDHKGREGYDAHLGERGVKLSGGQRQRIALARAILKDAPILVLDEATSALDSEVEAAIQSALNRVMEGKTVLAVAHRLSTIADMDRIVVLDAGRIVETGSHDDLLAADGLYARYWQRQSGGFLGLKDAAE